MRAPKLAKRGTMRAEIEHMNYTVQTIRQAGLEARWTRTRKGAPIIAARFPGKPWYVIDKHMWHSMQIEGVAKAFERHTLLGDFFSIPA